MHVIGSPGRGKSKFLEHVIREDIINGNGVCLIDPHRSLYDKIVRWCAGRGVFERRKVYLFEPGAGGWTFSFNPFDVSGADEDERAFAVGSILKVFSTVWGGENTDEKPLVERSLRITVHALAEKRLSLLEGAALTDFQSGALREAITRDLEDPYYRAQWAQFGSLSPAKLEERFLGVNNRFQRFIDAPIVRRTIGQLENTVDFRRLMDEKAVLLVDLSGHDRLTDEHTRLLGSLFINTLFLQARRRHRPEGRDPDPFYVYLDEAALFLNNDIKRILTEARKSGLHLTIAHQDLAQLEEAGDAIYRAVMGSAQVKVVFGGLSVADASVMAEEVYMGKLNLTEPKPFYTPAVTDYELRILRGGGRARGEFLSDTWSQAASEGMQEFMDVDGNVLRTAAGTGAMGGSSGGQGSSLVDIENWHESLTPIVTMEAMHAWSLEEQRYRATASIKIQPPQWATVLIPEVGVPDQGLWCLQTPTILEAYVSPEELDEDKLRAFETCGFATPTAVVNERLERRRLELQRAAHAERAAAMPEPQTAAAPAPEGAVIRPASPAPPPVKDDARDWLE